MQILASHARKLKQAGRGTGTQVFTVEVSDEGTMKFVGQNATGDKTVSGTISKGGALKLTGQAEARKTAKATAAAKKAQREAAGHAEGQTGNKVAE